MQRHLLRAAPVLMALLFGLGLAAAPALASPVAPIDVTIVQPDGTSFQAHPYGDEWTNGYETKDGYTLAREETTGFWEYADHDAAGRLKPSGWRPGKQSPPAVEKHLRDKTRAVNPNAAAASSALKSQMAPNIGSQSVLVILVQFTNQSSVGSSPANWSNAFFGSGASVKRYYEEASYGKFSFVPATTQGTAYPGVVGWLTLPYAHPNTGGNTSDANRQIVHDAIIAADPYVNYAGFDTNHDGYLSYDELHIVVVVAGYEAAYGGTAAACSPNVWAHRWALGDTVPAPQVDGVYAGGYAGGGGYLEFGEWDCATYDYPGHMATIGTAAHELGHDIRWPDLYDVDQSSEGVGVWSIMGSGGWLRTTGYAGSLPGHPDAFSKAYQGWLTPTQISGNQAGVTLSQVETNPQVVQLLDNPNGIDWLFGAQSGTGEYYLAENRQKTGFDAGLPGSGLLIWHIDESVTASNYANANEYHPLVGLEQADGLNQLQLKVNRGDVGDPYPGTSNNYTFNDTSNPNSKLYSGASSGASVTNISTGSSTISADFAGPGGGTTPTPTPTPTATPTAGPSSPIMAINAPSSGSTSTPP
ncbi:MAG: M6 family metalloprotease domain-containing protein, partial [Bacteroidetes bacterium]|nr:M6 family metalloprotease domain-containing protein [Bacteroidota bacterium]